MLAGTGVGPAGSPVLECLPYREIWCLDFEFRAPDGERPEPHCMVARELRSGRELRLWHDELEPDRPPFRLDKHALFIAYYASAELGCFLALGWPMPAHVLDLHSEHRASTNGRAVPVGIDPRRPNNLLAAMVWRGLNSMAAEAKTAMRDLALRGGPYSTDERQGLLAYCAADVDALARLLPAMLPELLSRQRDPSLALGQALLRGRYMAAAARIEWNGIPIDVPMLERLRAGWDGIKEALITEVDAQYGVFDGTTFKAARFAAYLERKGIPWPRLPSGARPLDEDTFRDQAKAWPVLQPLRELRHSLGELRLNGLALGPDGRNRFELIWPRLRIGAPLAWAAIASPMFMAATMM